MAKRNADPTAPIIAKARGLPEAIEGSSCTQTSFKVGKTAFLYIGEQGGRSKAMFKLADSMAEAHELAAKHPDDYQAGSTGWVTARFSAENPMPARRWQKWLRESYALAAKPTAGKKKAGTKKKATTKKATMKKKSGAISRARRSSS